MPIEDLLGAKQDVKEELGVDKDNVNAAAVPRFKGKSSTARTLRASSSVEHKAAKDAVHDLDIMVRVGHQHKRVSC